LVAEAYAEHRDVRGDELARRADRVVAGLGIAGAVREKYAVRGELEHFARARLSGNDRDAAAVVREEPQDVALYAEVVRDHVQALRGTDQRPLGVLPDAPLVPLERPLGAHDLGEVHALQAGKLRGSLDRGVRVHRIAGHDASGLRALLSQNARELACVD